MLRKRKRNPRCYDACREWASPLRARLERLEDRVVPAGNVIVEFSPGELGNAVSLTGDDLGNNVQIRAGELPNQIVIEGIDTTLNGSTASQTFDGILEVFGNLGAGDDTLATSNLSLTSIASLMVIDGGDGDDAITFSGLTFAGTSFSGLEIEGGSGADTIQISQSAFTSDSVALFVSAGDDDDEFTVSGSTFDGGDVNVSVDGGLGDDSIEVTGSNFHDFRRLVFEVDGDRTNATSAPSSGNDVIQASQIDMTSDSTSLQTYVAIYGDYNEGAVITGGNDEISVSKFNLTNSGAGGAGLTVVGDFNRALTVGSNMVTSTIGGGNDSISISDTSLLAMGNFPFNQASLTVIGDFDRAVSGGGGTVATIGSGNDRISISNTSAVATGPSSFVQVDIAGDDAATDGASLNYTTLARVETGNDRIVVDGLDVSADSVSGMAFINVAGERAVDFNSQISTPAATIGRGNDYLEFSRSKISNAGFAALFILGDTIGDATGQGNDTMIFSDTQLTSSGAAGFFLAAGIGNDNVLLSNVQIGVAPFTSISMGAGNDRLVIENSTLGNVFISMDQGNDELRLTANTFNSTFLDGGDGNDSLFATDNIGSLVQFGFESVDILP